MKHKKEKMLTIFLMLPLLMLVLIACTSNEGETSGTDGEEVVVEFFNQKPEITRQLEGLAQTYSEENENVRVTITTVGDSGGSAGLQAKFTSGNPPALMMLGGTSEIERYSETLDDVGDLEVTDTMIEDLLEGGNIDGTLLGIPLNIEGFGWMYNKEIFEQAGIDPAAIENYDDFVAVVEDLDSQKETLGIQEVFAFSGANEGSINQMSAHFTSPEFNHNTLDAYEAGQLNWEYGDQYQKYTDLFNQYNIQPILSVTYSRSVEELFANGEVPIIHQGNWIIPTLNSIDPEFVQNNLGILPVFGENDDEGRIVAGAPWYIGVNSDLEEPVVEAARDFLDWMYLSEEGQQAIVEEMQFIPPQKDFEVDELNDPVSKIIYQEMLDGNNSAMTHNQYPDGWFQLVLFPEYQRYLDGYSTWEEFLENTAQGFEEMRAH